MNELVREKYDGAIFRVMDKDLFGIKVGNTWYSFDEFKKIFNYLGEKE